MQALKVFSQAGFEPAPLGAKDRPSELPFVLIVTFVYPVHLSATPGKLSCRDDPFQSQAFLFVNDYGSLLSCSSIDYSKASCLYNIFTL